MLADASSLCDWLGSTRLSHAIQTFKWAIPGLQTIHILSIAALFTSAVLVDLRLWRLLNRDLSLKDVTQRFLPVIWIALPILLASGALLIIGEPRRSLLNSTFYIKMALLAFAVVLTVILQRTVSSDPNFWDKNTGRRLTGGVAAAASLLTWSGVLIAGRWIAYTTVG